MKNKKIKIVISFLLLFFVSQKIDFAQVFSILRQVNLWIYLLVLMIFFVNQSISSLKWKILLDGQGVSLPFFVLFKYYLMGTVLNLFLPTSVGGDVAKTFTILKKEKIDNNSAVYFATITDKLSGVLVLFIIVCIAFLFNYGLLKNTVLSEIFTLKILLPLFLAVVFILGALYVAIIQSVKVKVFFVNYMKSFFKFLKNKRDILKVIILSFSFHILAVINSYLLFRAIGASISVLFLFLAIPLNRLILSLPISYGGIGLNEISLISILSMVGVSSEAVVSFSILGYINILFLTFLYLSYFLFGTVAKHHHG